MGGSGGGGSYFPTPNPDLQDLFRETKEKAQQDQVDAEVNRLLRELNGSFERDTDKVREQLDAIGDILESRGDMEKFLFGGSVAKHTFVDGLSDVDALVLMKEGGLSESAPRDVIDRFAQLLRTRLLSPDVKEISSGQMAVTVVYRDGSEIQLLPAIRNADSVFIPSSQGSAWREVRPRAFHEVLSATNQKLSGTLVPTIKLIKSLTSGLPEQKQLTGYHIEALSMEAARVFQGPFRMREVLLHVLQHSSSRVLRPIKDLTGQSHNVDDYLGEANSTKRRIVADGLNTLTRRLADARTVEEWRKILES